MYVVVQCSSGSMKASRKAEGAAARSVSGGRLIVESAVAATEAFNTKSLLY